MIFLCLYYAMVFLVRFACCVVITLLGTNSHLSKVSSAYYSSFLLSVLCNLFCSDEILLFEMCQVYTSMRRTWQTSIIIYHLLGCRIFLSRTVEILFWTCAQFWKKNPLNFGTFSHLFQSLYKSSFEILLFDFSMKFFQLYYCLLLIRIMKFYLL